MTHPAPRFFLLLTALLPLAGLRAGPESAGPQRGPPPRMEDGRTRAPADRYLRRLRQSDPEEFQRMRRLRRDDPDAFREALREKVMRRRGGEAPARRHPLHGEIQALRDAQTPEERAEAEAELRGQLGRMIDRQLQRREERVERIREQLRELEERHRREREQREELIERHMRRIRAELDKTPQTGEKPVRP